MTKRLQVLLDDDEFRELQESARRRRIPVAELVRQTLRAASSADSVAKRRAVETAATYAFPVADIDVLLAEIEVGHAPDPGGSGART